MIIQKRRLNRTKLPILEHIMALLSREDNEALNKEIEEKEIIEAICRLPLRCRFQTFTKKFIFFNSLKYCFCFYVQITQLLIGNSWEEHYCLARLNSCHFFRLQTLQISSHFFINFIILEHIIILSFDIPLNIKFLLNDWYFF